MSRTLRLPRGAVVGVAPHVGREHLLDGALDLRQLRDAQDDPRVGEAAELPPAGWKRGLDVGQPPARQVVGCRNICSVRARYAALPSSSPGSSGATKRKPRPAASHQRSRPSALDLGIAHEAERR